MEEAFRSHLVAQAGLITLVGQRIQWGVREGDQCIALQLIDAPPETHLRNRSSLVRARVQADCWSPTFLGSKAVGDALKASLPAIGQIVGDTRFKGCLILDEERGPFGDQPNRLFRTRIDIRVSFNRSI